MVNKKTFDLIIATDLAVLVLWGGFSMWSRRRLMDGPNSGVLHGTAKVVKAVTA